ncbi:protein-ER retention protein [Sorochytrium milnesiophthora]
MLFMRQIVTVVVAAAIAVFLIARYFSFSSLYANVHVPTAFRALLLIDLALVGWAVNVSLLARVGVNMGTILKTRPAGSTAASVSGTSVSVSALPLQVPYHQRKHGPVSAARILTAAAYVAIWWSAMLWAYHQSEQTLAVRSAYVSGLLYATLLLVLCLPVNILCYPERWAFVRSMGRLFKPSLSAKVYFCDVLLADVLTSFAKVLGDLADTLCVVLLQPGGASGSAQSAVGTQSGYQGALVLLVTMLPFLVRLKQCIAEYRASASEASSVDSTSLSAKNSDETLHNLVMSHTTDSGASQDLYREPHIGIKLAAATTRPTYLPMPKTAAQRHLLNALKYASALPVVALSALLKQRSHIAHAPGVVPKAAHSSTGFAFFCWYVFVLINSVYSFYWDVCIDWSLGQRPTTPQYKYRTPPSSTASALETEAMMPEHTAGDASVREMTGIQRRTQYSHPLHTPTHTPVNLHFSSTPTTPNRPPSPFARTTTSSPPEQRGTALLAGDLPSTLSVLPTAASPAKPASATSPASARSVSPPLPPPITTSFPSQPPAVPALFPPFTRLRRLFPAYVYYVAIFLDFILRFSWSITVPTTTKTLATSSSAPPAADGATAAAAVTTTTTVISTAADLAVALQVLEVFRRWVWLFLRIEREWVQQRQHQQQQATTVVTQQDL